MHYADYRNLELYKDPATNLYFNSSNTNFHLLLMLCVLHSSFSLQTKTHNDAYQKKVLDLCTLKNWKIICHAIIPLYSTLREQMSSLLHSNRYPHLPVTDPHNQSQATCFEYFIARHARFERLGAIKIEKKCIHQTVCDGKLYYGTREKGWIGLAHD